MRKPGDKVVAKHKSAYQADHRILEINKEYTVEEIVYNKTLITLKEIQNIERHFGGTIIKFWYSNEYFYTEEELEKMEHDKEFNNKVKDLLSD